MEQMKIKEKLVRKVKIIKSLKIKCHDIQIQKIFFQEKPASKSLIIQNKVKSPLQKKCQKDK